MPAADRQSDELTAAAHLPAVEQVIHAMHTQLHTPLSLDGMAEIACLSPYHFNRVFRRIVGIPPGEFLAALRLDTAKRLLLTTPLDVTDICFEVGYSSLGTFTTRFTHLVGLSPRRLRHLAAEFAPPDLSEQQTEIAFEPLALSSSGCLTGQINTPPDITTRAVFAGLFPKPIPQIAPVACTLTLAPGPYQIDPVPDGHYYLLAAALPLTDDPATYLLPGRDLLVGKSAGPLVCQRGMWRQAGDITLRPPCPTDPPILLFLPQLLNQWPALTK